MEKLSEYRKEIEEIDGQLIVLLSKRMKLSSEIGDYKRANGLPVYDPKREEELKEKNLSKVEPELQAAYKEIFDVILKVSKDLQL